MEKIERPVKISKMDKQVISEKNYKENTDKQLGKIYDKLDEIVNAFSNSTEQPEEPQAEPFSYKDFEVSQVAIPVSGLSTGNSKNFSVTVQKEGFFPLCLASTTCINYTNAGFVIEPIRLSSRTEGKATIYCRGENYASPVTSSTGYCDILWVKIK